MSVFGKIKAKIRKLSQLKNILDNIYSLFSTQSKMKELFLDDENQHFQKNVIS